MPLSRDSPWRGVASCFGYHDPDVENDDQLAEYVLMTVDYFNRAHLVFRDPRWDMRHVFRWDTRPYQVIFRYGFRAREQGVTPDEVYFDLNDHIHAGGAPLTSDDRHYTHVFISTSSVAAYTPIVSRPTLAYRYEIYAPGGIIAAQSLDTYEFPSQSEISFIHRIHPRFIYCVEVFQLTPFSFVSR